MFWTFTISATEEVQVLLSVTVSVTGKFCKPVPMLL